MSGPDSFASKSQEKLSLVSPKSGNDRDNFSSSTYYLLNRGQARNLPTIDILNESMEKIRPETDRDKAILVREFGIEEETKNERIQSEAQGDAYDQFNI